MPHFYFHLHDGRSRVEDRRGAWLPDEEAAWYQAYRAARELLSAEARERLGWGGHCLEVEDERGARVWTLPLSEVAELAS